MLREKVIASRTWTKKLPATHPLAWGTRPSYTLTAEAKLYALGEQAPYFSLTGELRNLRKRGDNQVEMAGCMHEELVREWPELAPLAAIHLSDENGVPMHHVANAAYWLGFTQYKTAEVRKAPDKGVEKVDLPYLPYFTNLWRIDEVEARNIYEMCIATAHPRLSLELHADHMLGRWKREAEEALALIRGES